MADETQIKLAGFQFDTSRLEASLNNLQTTYFNLKKEQEGYNNLAKEQQKAMNALTLKNLKLAKAEGDNTKAIQENEKAIEELNTAQQQNLKNSQNVGNNLARVRQELNATNKELRAYMDSEGQQISLIDAGNKALQTQVANINQARASNTELLRVRNQLNPAITQEKKLIDELNKKMDENNKFIKTNASEYEKQKINIGNYSESIKQAIGELGGLNGTLGNAEKALNVLTPAFSGLKTEAQQAFDLIRGGTVATEGLSKAQIVSATTTNVVAGALKLFRVALISTGIGAIVVLLGSLIGYLTSTQEGIDALSAVLAPFKAIFSVLGKLFNEVGRSLVEVFKNPKQALQDFGKLLKENIMNRIEGLMELIPNLGKAIKLLFSGEFSEAGKVAFDSLAKVGTGVEGLSGKIGQFATDTANAMAEAARKGMEIDRLTKEIAKSTLEYNKAQIAVGDELDKNNLTIKDTSKSYKERAAAAEANIAITEKNGQAEKKILELELQRLKIQQELQGVNNLTNEDKQAEIDLLKKIDEAEDRGLNARLENSRVLAGLRKEQADAAAKETDRRLKALQTELDIYIESQGIRKKSMKEQIELDREIMRQSLAINKAEFDAKKKTRREYELENLQIKNEFLAKQTEATIANADLELQMFLMNNQRKIEANTFFSETIYQQELDRINKIAEAEADLQTKRYAAGLISLEEYNLAVAEIDRKQYEANKAAQEEREAAKKEKQAADLILQDEINQQREDYDLQLALENFDRQAEAEKEALRKKGADEELIEKVFAERRKEIEKQVQDNKLILTSSTLSNIGKLLGESSKAGKAVAIAQTTIDTYRGATAAYASLAQIPVVGPALGVAAAAAAVAAGLQNVKKIAQTPTGGEQAQSRPGYARGIIGIDGLGSGTSDSIDVRLSNGESVITAQATSLFPNTLAAINQAGGGVGLDGNLASTIAQNNITERADAATVNIPDAALLGMYNAISEGAKKGLKDMATDRTIMENAKF